MKILHTADWHLGRRLYRQKRENEHNQFLNWLLTTIEQEKVDVLIVAGDIFDSPTPPIYAQEQYYNFLHRLQKMACASVIIGGNHDSPAFLSAPAALLKTLNIHIVGAVENGKIRTFVLKNAAGESIIISAVPYLREKDLRFLTMGETAREKAAKAKKAMANYYQQAGADVKKLRQQVGNLPAIATGHLFAAGATTTDDDGVRELYVGSLSHVAADIFPPDFDYVALGHIHVPQKVAGLAHVRYSGAPIPMGFGEAKQEKHILLVDFAGDKTMRISELAVPTFQALARYRGDRQTLENAIKKHVDNQDNIWLELHYDAHEVDATLHSDLQALCSDSEVNILCIRNPQPILESLSAVTVADLRTLTPEMVFAHFLEAKNIPESQHPELIAAHEEILHGIWQKE